MNFETPYFQSEVKYLFMAETSSMSSDSASNPTTAGEITTARLGGVFAGIHYSASVRGRVRFSRANMVNYDVGVVNQMLSASLTEALHTTGFSHMEQKSGQGMPLCRGRSVFLGKKH